MDKASVTNELSHLLSGKKVIAGVFTTFNFEPEFFELDVVPELLRKGIPYSSDERVKIFQVREALRESNLKLDVFYDLQIFRSSAERSPEMEYLCHGVNSGNNAFHAKNIYLLVEDNESKDSSLLVASGSNNITRAGWWSNIEALHWEEVIQGEVQRAFVNRLKEDIAWLQSKKSLSAKSALSLIKEFLNKCKSSNRAPAINYYSLGSNNFFKFLKNIKNSPFEVYSNWKLEIISPYFCEDPFNTQHTEFTKLGVKKITVFLPFDHENIAQCHPDYYEHIKNFEGIEWGRWKPSMVKAIGIDGELYRRLHAKIYHFYNGRQAWAFVGSINFSHKAFKENIESGFFLKLAKAESMLEPLAESEIIESFAPPSDDESGINNNKDEPLPELHLTYDWKTKQLIGRTAKRKKYDIQLINSENEAVISPWQIAYQEGTYQQDVTNLESILKQTSLVIVEGKDTKTGKTFLSHRLMVQQTGWTHKPIELPKLTPEQILAIYAGMNHEQRQMTVVNALLKELLKLNVSGEITALDEEQVETQFFCEYAEIFHAFRVLRELLQQALTDKNFEKVDYYLTGTGMDSLPSLVELACDEKSSIFNGVTAYLLLLSATEVLKESDFYNRLNVKDYLVQLKDKLERLKEGSAISLEGGSEERKVKFFSWFEEQFSKEYIESNYAGDSLMEGAQ